MIGMNGSSKTRHGSSMSNIASLCFAPLKALNRNFSHGCHVRESHSKEQRKLATAMCVRGLLVCDRGDRGDAQSLFAIEAIDAIPANQRAVGLNFRGCFFDFPR